MDLMEDSFAVWDDDAGAPWAADAAAAGASEFTWTDATAPPTERVDAMDLRVLRDALPSPSPAGKLTGHTTAATPAADSCRRVRHEGGDENEALPVGDSSGGGGAECGSGDGEAAAETEAEAEATAMDARASSWRVDEHSPLAMVEGGEFGIPKDVYGKLFDYQRDGVAWMWSLYPAAAEAPPRGGILADDMGLGKTVQVVAFVAGLFHSEAAETVLVVAPVSLLPVWEAEFARWAPELRVKTYHGAGAGGGKADRAIASVAKRGGVLLTSYGMCSNRPAELGATHVASEGEEAGGGGGGGRRRKRAGDGSLHWDVLVLDEGHKIKNPSTLVSRAVSALPASFRLLLTGTPVQNNLDELWALFTFATFGAVLGTRRTFNSQVAGHIIQARDRHASASDKVRGRSAATLLTQLIRPYVIRREKEALLAAGRLGGGGGGGAAGGAAGGAGVSAASPAALPTAASDALPPPPPMHLALGTKTEVVVWTTLDAAQRDMYTRFLNTEDVKAVLNRSCSPLAAITVLKKIACHPALLGDALAAVAPAGTAAATTSAKLACFNALAANLLQGSHRVLVFSQSKRMLDILAGCLRDMRPWAHEPHRAPGVVRIDGDVLKADDRRAIVARFNTDGDNVQVCLLTTGVGALGLTLTGADRVIIYDPSWNPAVEQQAVDRAYRVGQSKDVVTYRLITCGTVEEKMYRLQVFKGGVSSSIMGAASRTTAGGIGRETARVLNRSELRDIFTLGDTAASETQALIDALPEKPAPPPPAVAAHLARITAGCLGAACVGMSFHDYLFRVAGGRRPPAASAAAAAASASTAVPAADDYDGGAKEAEWLQGMRATIAHEAAGGLPVERDGPAARRTPRAPRVPLPDDEAVPDFDYAAVMATPAAVVSPVPPSLPPSPVAASPAAAGDDDGDAGRVGSDDYEAGDDIHGAASPAASVASSVTEVGRRLSPLSQGVLSPTDAADAADADDTDAAPDTPDTTDAADDTDDTDDAVVEPPSPSPEPPAAGCCAAHAATLARGLGGAAVPATRCSCGLSPGSTDLLSYATATLEEALAAAADGSGDEEQLADALETGLDALTVCDADAGLHLAVMRLAARLGWLPASTAAAASSAT